MHVLPLEEEVEGEDTLMNDERHVGEPTVAVDQCRHSPLSLQGLPPEILSEIFISWLHLPSTNSSRTQNPILLSHVCGSWRAIALGTPRLWTHPHLTLHTDQVTDNHRDILSEFLDRSNPHPISLWLATYPEYSATRDAYKLLDAVLPFADRVLSLALDLPNFAHYALQSTYRPMITKFPLLESVDIAVRNAGEKVDHFRTPILDAAPRLRELVLSGGSVDGCDGYFLRCFALPWSQLTTLHAENVFNSPTQACHILCQCTSLERCSLSVPTWHHGDTVHTLPVSTLSHLYEMEIAFEGHAQGFSAFFFQPLQLPGLTTLDLTAPLGHDIREAMLYQTVLFDKVGTTLTHLRIINLHLNPVDVIPFLGALPVLVSLSFELCHVATDDLFFDALVYEGSISPIPLVPSLQHLEILEYGKDGSDITPAAVVRMVLGRWWSDSLLDMVKPDVARWKSIRISWDDEEPMVFDADELRALDRCREEGLRLSIS